MTKCKNCGKSYIMLPKHWTHKHNFCSTSCYLEYNNENKLWSSSIEYRSRANMLHLNIKLINDLNESIETLNISKYAKDHGKLIIEIKQLINKAIKEDIIEGKFTDDGTRFITLKTLRKKIKDRIR